MKKSKTSKKIYTKSLTPYHYDQQITIKQDTFTCFNIVIMTARNYYPSLTITTRVDYKHPL